MKNSPSRLLCAVVLAAVYIAVGGAEALGATGCSHHGAVPTSQGANQNAPHGPSHEHGSDGDAHPAPCVCVGVCHAAGSVPVEPITAGIQIALAEYHRDVATGEGVVLVPIPHSLPFANAPPLA